jgi:hypothetical protein
MFVRVRFINKKFNCALYTQEQLCKLREEFSYSIASGISMYTVTGSIPPATERIPSSTGKGS